MESTSTSSVQEFQALKQKLEVHKSAGVVGIDIAKTKHFAVILDPVGQTIDIDIPTTDVSSTITMNGSPLPPESYYGSTLTFYLVSLDTETWHQLTTVTFDGPCCIDYDLVGDGKHIVGQRLRIELARRLHQWISRHRRLCPRTLASAKDGRERLGRRRRRAPRPPRPLSSAQLRVNRPSVNLNVG